MKKFEVNSSKCVGCGLCQERCYPKMITIEDHKATYKDDFSNCMDCFHCISICPNHAISYNNSRTEKIEVLNRKNDYHPVLSRRSCRHYKNTSVDQKLLAEMINGANMAPRHGIRFQERKFIVITDKTKLREIRALLISQIEKSAKMLSVFSKLPVFSKAKKENYATISNFLTQTVERNKEKDTLLNNAPILIMVTGDKNNVASPDNCHYAMGQLLILAEQHNLGACINGYISFFSKAVGKYLGIPKQHKIFAAAILGYPQNYYTSYVKRNGSDIQWN